jgi:hypothetical protein
LMFQLFQGSLIRTSKDTVRILVYGPGISPLGLIVLREILIALGTI